MEKSKEYLEQHYLDHIIIYIKTIGGKYILLEGDDNKINISSYQDKYELNQALEKRDSRLPFIYKKVPLKLGGLEKRIKRSHKRKSDEQKLYEDMIVHTLQTSCEYSDISIPARKSRELGRFLKRLRDNEERARKNVLEVR